MLLIVCVKILSLESSTSSPADNQVDGLPPVSNDKMKLRFMLTQSNSGAVVFSLRMGYGSIGYLATLKTVFENSSSIPGHLV